MMMKTNQTNCKSTTFLRFLIYSYRILGTTFGGISFDGEGNLIKSPFWLYYGWFGCIIYFFSMMFFVLDSLHQQIFEQLDKYNNGRSVYYMVVVIWPIVGSSMISSIVYTNQKFGFKIFKIFIKYSLTKFKKLKLVKMVLIVYFMVWLITFVVQSSIYNDERVIINSFANNFVMMPLFTSIMSVSWMVSIGFSENMKIVRQYLNKNMRSIQLTEVNKFLLTNYKNIKKIDEYLAFSNIISTVQVVLCVMSSVYVCIFARRIRFLISLIEFNIPLQTVQYITFILNCFFLGKLSKETEKLLNHLDNLNININDDQLFKAFILLRTSVDKVKCGFTIGGFAPWNMLTLLQVTSCYSLIIL